MLDVNGQIEQVRACCMQDVVQTAALFLRVQLLRSELLDRPVAPLFLLGDTRGTR